MSAGGKGKGGAKPAGDKPAAEKPVGGDKKGGDKPKKKEWINNTPITKEGIEKEI